MRVALADRQRMPGIGLVAARHDDDGHRERFEVINALERPRSVAELCALITAEFDVSASDCEADVVAFLAGLQEEGLIEVAEDA